MALSAKELAALHARVQYAHYNGFSLAKADEYAAALGSAHPEGVAKTSTAHLLAVTTKQVTVPHTPKPVPAKPGVSTVNKTPVQTKPVAPPVHTPPSHEPGVENVQHPSVPPINATTHTAPIVPPPHASAAEHLPTVEEVLGEDHEDEHEV